LGRGRSRLRQLPVPDLRPAAGARALGREFHRSRRGDAEAANAIAADVGHRITLPQGQRGAETKRGGKECGYSFPPLFVSLVLRLRWPYHRYSESGQIYDPVLLI